MPAVVTLGMRVRLVRGCIETVGKPGKYLPFMPWCGGEVPVGALGTLALETKTPNMLLSERVRQSVMPDRVVVIWDTMGVKPVSYKQPGSGRESEGQHYSFVISARLGEPLPDYLEEDPTPHGFMRDWQAPFLRALSASRSDTVSIMQQLLVSYKHTGPHTPVESPQPNDADRDHLAGEREVS